MPGVVAHACNPSTLGGWVEWITWGQEFETSLANMVKPCLKKKKKRTLKQYNNKKEYKKKTPQCIITTIKYLHSVYIVLGIISNLETKYVGGYA